MEEAPFMRGVRGRRVSRSYPGQDAWSAAHDDLSELSDDPVSPVPIPRHRDIEWRPGGDLPLDVIAVVKRTSDPVRSTGLP